MAQHVQAGGKSRRQRSAFERLTIHLKDHKANHDKLTKQIKEDYFESHDKCQKAEYERIKSKVQ